MGTTPTLADGEEFVEGRSQEKAAELVSLAEAAGLKGSVRTTYKGYIVPSAIFAHDEANETQETPESPGNPDVPAPPTDKGGAVEFDPSEATVAEVQEYLEGADDEERARVIAAEEAGKARKTVLELATTKEGN